MAAAAAAHLKIQSQPTAANTTTTTTKPKRRKCRDITISANPPQLSPQSHQISDSNSLSGISSNTTPTNREIHSSPTSSSSTSYSPRSTPQPPPPMDFSYSHSNGAVYDALHTNPASFTKFNSVLTAGLLNPMSSPPQTTPPIDKTNAHNRSSPTLFEMMTNDPESLPRNAAAGPPPPTQNGGVSSARPVQDKQLLMQQRISHLLGSRSPGTGTLFNDTDSSDIRLTLTDKDGFSVTLSVHRQVLVANSSFFAGRLSERGTKPPQRSEPFEVEIADCDDVEVYVETLRLMYCKHLRPMLVREDVPKVLGILKISAVIGFQAGVLSCLEYLEAAPWTEDEEEKVASLLSELRLERTSAATEVLKRISLDTTCTSPAAGEQQQVGSGIQHNEHVLMKLLQVVLEGKDEKARREMKVLVSKMLRENENQNDLRKESLYSACEGCLHRLQHLFLEAAQSDLKEVGHIAKEADNLYWLLGILIDRQISEDFLDTWANQSEMSAAHPKVPPVHRFEVSRVTARLFVGIGKGQLLASKDSRCLLIKTWLGPLYDDFRWIRRASKGLDRHLIEDGLSNTILTLPLSLQQEVLLAWFDRFLSSGEDCPNIQRGFEMWWRRAFWRRRTGDAEHPRVHVATSENS